MLDFSKSKKAIFSIFLLLLIPQLFFAQDYKPDDARDIEFWEAPVIDGKYVRMIKEWRRYKGADKVQLTTAYHFNGNGALGKVELNSPTKNALWLFPRQANNQFERISHYEDSDSITYAYAFLDDRDVVEKRLRDQIWKTIYYKDSSGKIIEKKEFYYDDEEVGLEYRLIRRTVYNYYADGNILGEMRYDYPEGGMPLSRKITYAYNRPNGVLTEKESYSPNNYLTEKELRFHTDDDLLIKEEKRSKINGQDHVMFSKDNMYDSDGMIAKSISRVYDANSKTVMRETQIFKDGRLIYRRVDDAKGFLFESNFQYLTK